MTCIRCDIRSSLWAIVHFLVATVSLPTHGMRASLPPVASLLPQGCSNRYADLVRSGVKTPTFAQLGWATTPEAADRADVQGWSSGGAMPWLLLSNDFRHQLVIVYAFVPGGGVEAVSGF